MLEQHGITGRWEGSAATSDPELVSDYIAGLLVTTTGGDETRGPPEKFRSISGESGTEILQRVLRPPRPDSLRGIAASRGGAGVVERHGAFAASVALSGRIEPLRENRKSPSHAKRAMLFESGKRAEHDPGKVE